MAMAYPPTMTIVPASSVSRRGQTYQVQRSQPQYVHQYSLDTQPSQQMVQTRVVQVTQTKNAEATIPAVRKFVNFKNLRDRNKPGRQWEHCEHIAINLSPDELEQKVQQHNYPGNDLIRCLTSMGIFRQKHVRNYEHKLNHRESDPGNWTWVLEALGEVRDHKSSTPHTFWAIFRRSPRNGTQQTPARQIVVHNEPVQSINNTTQQPQQTLVVTPALPSPLALTTLPPAPTQLALPAPPVATTTYSPSTHLLSSQPANSIAESTYQLPQTTVQPTQYEATTTTQTTTYQPASATTTSYATQIVQPQAATSTPMRAIAAPPANTTSTTTVRQLTQAYGQGNATSNPKQYTRPIPGILQRQSGDLGFRTASETDVRRYQVRDSSPNRYNSPHPQASQRWYDEDGESMSEDSDAGSYGSSSGTSVTNYTPCGKPRSPLGNQSNSHDRERDRRSRPIDSRSRNQSTQSLRRGHVSYIPASSDGHDNRVYATAIPASSMPASTRPLKQRQSTYEVDIKFERIPSARPAPIRRATTSDRTPRSYNRNNDTDYEYESADDVYGRSQGHGPSRNVPRAPMPSSYSGERRYHH